MGTLWAHTGRYRVYSVNVAIYPLSQYSLPPGHNEMAHCTPPHRTVLASINHPCNRQTMSSVRCMHGIALCVLLVGKWGYSI